MNNTLEVVKMLSDWIFIQPLEDDMKEGRRVYAGTEISKPDTKKEVTQKGVVLKMGDEVYKDEKNLNIGDQILFKRRAGFQTLNIDGHFVMSMKPEAIMAVAFGEHVTDVSPLRDYVFLEWQLAANEYAGSSILRPDSHKKLHFTGHVKAKGPDVKQLKLNDRVFFDQWGGVEMFQEDGQRYCFIREGDIYCSGVPERKEAVAV